LFIKLTRFVKITLLIFIKINIKSALQKTKLVFDVTEKSYKEFKILISPTLNDYIE